MKYRRPSRLGFIFFLSVLFVFSSAGASGKRPDSKTKEDEGWNISDSSGDDGFAEEDNGGDVPSHFKDDSDDTYEDDVDCSGGQMKSKFKDDPDEDDSAADPPDQGL